MKSRNKDRADAVFITAIISMFFLLACMGTTLDIAKNVKLKIDQNSNVQQAASTAVKTVNSRGSLDDRAPYALVEEYLKQSGAETWNNDTLGVSDFQDEGAAFRQKPECRTRDITLANGTPMSQVKLPYIIIKMDAGRSRTTPTNTPVYVSQGGQEPELVSGEFDPKVKYKVINAEVHDAVNNVMLNMFNVPCQNLRSDISAIAFGSNEDLVDVGTD